MEKKLILFMASYCGKCHAIKKRIKLLKNRGLFDIECTYIDVDEDKATAKKHAIEGIPTVLIFEDGVEVKRITGSLYQEDLLELAK